MSEGNSPYPLFSDGRGGLLEGGQIFIGAPSNDPEIAPVGVFWDEAMTVPAAQPLRTAGGVVVNGGSPALFFVEGAYSMRVRRSDGALVSYRPVATDQLTGLRTDLAGAGGAAMVGTPYGSSAALIGRAPVTPEDYLSIGDRGNKGQTSAQAASLGFNFTEAAQDAADAASNEGRIFSGGGRWYMTDTVSWPSRTRCEDYNVFVANSTVDTQPFLINGRQSPKSNYRFSRCAVHGNRLNQKNLSTSGTNGQRSAWMLTGEFEQSVTDVILDQCVAWYCATDAVWTWCNGVAQPSGTGYFFRDILLRDCDLQWNGRHGGSLMGTKGFRAVGGRMKNNGLDMPGYSSGIFSDGGYGRRLDPNLTSSLFGRPWDCESYLLGEGFEDISFESVDMRDNHLGLLFYHRWHGSAPCRNLRVESCYLNDPGGGAGDGILSTYALNDATSATYTGSDAIVGVQLINIYGSDNYVNLGNASEIDVVGGYARITKPGIGNSAIFPNSSDVRTFTLDSNKRPFERPMPLTRISTTTPSAWTIGTQGLELLADMGGGRYHFQYSVSVTPSATGDAGFTATFSSGWKLRPVGKPNSRNSNSGAQVNTNAFPSSAGMNALDFTVTANGLNPTAIYIDFIAERV